MQLFHAGSLTAAFDDLEDGFTERYDAAVSQESAGSVRSTKKITQPPHRAADVLAVADFRLLRDDLLPDYGDWYAIFSTNAMTLAYTDDSAYADEITPDNWWDVLTRDDVSVAHSDPAVDPNGYRSLMSMDLGAIPFRGDALYDDATARSLKDNAHVPASDEVALLSQLHSGKIDYAWEYQSTSATHDVNTLDLQHAVDLSKATSAYADHYAKATVNAGGTTYTGAPIAYGITVPNTAEHPDWGAKWIAYALGDGADVVARDGFSALDTAVVPASSSDAVPDAVMAEAKAKSSLGPLSL
ncbi:tungstate ABC transporter substrate-binding protein WtpA [Halarchaeum nitratireducens]|uniref:Tungstate ABC transporter substrate-binding protein WtpA n=1 Tax=Halarchaeum nitratireducens TaxID=489913 RepID=A0A830G9X5_9EURY|nr:tungstate ABC transporter substrate-binding protein WtpA [Halarchaeum nitratireducens]